MPISNEEAARQVLEHMADIAPNSSENIACMLQWHKTKKTPIEYNALFKSQREGEWFNRLEIITSNFTEPKPRPGLALKKKASELIERGVPLTISVGYKDYEFIKEFKRGYCGDISGAAAFYAYKNFNISITFMNGDNFTHFFIIFGELQVEVGKKINVSEIPDSCVIVDPWIRCKFSPSMVCEYWGAMAELFEWDARTEGYMAEVVDHVQSTPRKRAFLQTQLSRLEEMEEEHKHKGCEAGYMSP